MPERQLEFLANLAIREGEHWIRFSADLPMAICEILKGRLFPRDYLRSLRIPVESAIFAWDDPLPGLLELPSLMSLLGKRISSQQGI